MTTIYERLPNDIQETINFKVWGEVDRKYKNLTKGKEELKKVLYNDIKNLLVNNNDLFFKDYRMNNTECRFWSKEFIKHIENYYYTELDKAFIKGDTNAIIKEVKLCIKLFSNMGGYNLNYHKLDIDMGDRLVHLSRVDDFINNEFFRIFKNIENCIPYDEPDIVIHLQKEFYKEFITQLNRFLVSYRLDDNRRFH